MIRYATHEDLPFLLKGLEENRIIEQRPPDQIKASPADIESFQSSITDQHVLIFEEAQKAVGFLHFVPGFKVLYFPQPVFWIDLIYIESASRGKGIGNTLYKEAGKVAKVMGFGEIVLDVFDANQNSLAFHEKAGFQRKYGIFTKNIYTD